MKTWGSSLARRMASCHRNKQQDEERTTPTHRYTVTPALRRIAKMTTALVHRESFFWYLTYVMAEVSIYWPVLPDHENVLCIVKLPLM